MLANEGTLLISSTFTSWVCTVKRKSEVTKVFFFYRGRRNTRDERNKSTQSTNIRAHFDVF